MARAPQRPGHLRPTFASRATFYLALTYAAIVTPPLAISLLINNLFSPNARTFKRWLTIWGRVLLAGLRVRVKTDVRADIPRDQPIVLVANHQSMIDIITCAAAIPYDYGYAAKAELRKVPFIGAVLERCACVFVDRSNARKAVQSIRDAAVLIRGGNSVLVYPEGERTYGPYLGPFLRGAFMLAVEAGVPIVPVVQLDNFAALDEKRRVARPGTVHVVVCEPIPTSGCSRKDIPDLVEQVYRVMERELEAFHGIPIGLPPDKTVSSGAPPTPPQ